MSDNDVWPVVVAVVETAVIIGVPGYLAILGFREFKDWANRKVIPLYEEGVKISSADKSRPVLQYAVTGFVNVGIEWRQDIYVDHANIGAVRDLLLRTKKVSYMISAVSVVGILYGTLLTWINYRSATRRVALYEMQLQAGPPN